jgi:hypothetical protein
LRKTPIFSAENCRKSLKHRPLVTLTENHFSRAEKRLSW